MKNSTNITTLAALLASCLLSIVSCTAGSRLSRTYSPKVVFTQEQLDKKLFAAAENGNLPLVQKLIAQGANVHAKDDAAFRIAAKYGYASLVKYLLELPEGQRPNVHAAGDEALWESSVHGQVPVAEVLFAHGATIPIEADRTIYWLARNKRWAVVASWLLNGANKWELTHEELNDLYNSTEAQEYMTAKAQKALQHNDEQLLEKILNIIPLSFLPAQIQEHISRAYPNLVTIHQQRNQEFIAAAETPNLHRIQQALAAGVDIHAQDDKALRLAAENGHWEVVAGLLELGAYKTKLTAEQLREFYNSPRAQNYVGVQILNAIENRDWQEEEKFLGIIPYSYLSDQIRTDIQSKRLVLASQFGKHLQVLDALSKGADIHAGDDLALRRAAFLEGVGMIELLMRHGANIHAGNDLALRVNAARRDWRNVVWLLKSGADKTKLTQERLEELYESIDAQYYIAHEIQKALERKDLQEITKLLDIIPFNQFSDDIGIRIQQYVAAAISLALQKNDLSTLQHLLDIIPFDDLPNPTQVKIREFTQQRTLYGATRVRRVKL